jgi:hypothetical protein
MERMTDVLVQFYQEMPAEGFRSLLEVQAAVDRLVKTVKPRKIVIEFVGEHIRLVEADSKRVLHLISLDTVCILHLYLFVSHAARGCTDTKHNKGWAHRARVRNH